MPTLPAPFHLDVPPPVLLGIAAMVGLLLLAQRVAAVRALVSLGFTVGLGVLLFAVARERAPFDPVLARIADRLHLDEQQVAGRTVRIRVSPDGHYWARVRFGGVERRMLVDSGATVTAISARTAAAAGLKVSRGVMPVLMRTANGTVAAETARVRELRLGDIVARDLAVVVSPSFGPMDVLGMNFLSRLKSWRVEDGVLVLEPHHPVAARPAQPATISASAVSSASTSPAVL